VGCQESWFFTEWVGLYAVCGVSRELNLYWVGWFVSCLWDVKSVDSLLSGLVCMLFVGCQESWFSTEWVGLFVVCGFSRVLILYWVGWFVSCLWGVKSVDSLLSGLVCMLFVGCQESWFSIWLVCVLSARNCEWCSFFILLQVPFFFALILRCLTPRTISLISIFVSCLQGSECCRHIWVFVSCLFGDDSVQFGLCFTW
jgi:hypothetical protein